MVENKGNFLSLHYIEKTYPTIIPLWDRKKRHYGAPIYGSIYYCFISTVSLAVGGQYSKISPG